MAAKGAKVAPVIVHQRAAFVNAVIDGRTAMELEPAGKAAAEIAELWEWMNGQAR
jgi:chromosome partitioning protein